MIIEDNESVQPLTIYESITQINWYYWYLWILDDLPPANIDEVEVNHNSLHCYAYIFRDCICLDTLPKWNTWQLRYFTVDKNGFHSVSCKPEGRHGHTAEQAEIIDVSHASEVIVDDEIEFKFSILF